MEAVAKKSLNSAVELIECEHGYQDRSGCTALMYAAEKGLTEIVTRLLDYEKRRRSNRPHESCCKEPCRCSECLGCM